MAKYVEQFLDENPTFVEFYLNKKTPSTKVSVSLK